MAFASTACKDDSNFVFDLDGVASATADEFEAHLSTYTTILRRQATPNGYHIVTEPFDYTSLETDVEYEVTDPTLLRSP